MIELVNFTSLNTLLNQCLGANWPDTMMQSIRIFQRDTAKQEKSEGR
jgi:hypothetical protein